MKLIRFSLLALALPGLPTATPAAADTELFELLASDGEDGHSFGHRVSISGNRALVGAIHDDTNGVGAGSAYLFDVTTGQQLFKLLPSDGKAIDWFGSGLAICGDLAVIGAPETDDQAHDSGSIYFFDATTGQQLEEVNTTDGTAGDAFGWSVGMSGDRAVIGAPYDDHGGPMTGSAYVFDTALRRQVHKLLPLDAPDGLFGWSVAICGNRAIVGTPFDDTKGHNAGSAYLFDVDTGQQLFKLYPNDPAPNDEFGYSVGISGGYAVVGSHYDDWNGPDSGSAYVFDVTTGQLVFKLLAGDGMTGDAFGESVSVSGERIVVGAYLDEEAWSDAGSAYVFDVTTGHQIQKLVASNPYYEDRLGNSVAISGDRALAGAPGRWTEPGAAYVFAVDTEPGSGFCFGDPGVGTPCPCNNDNDGSVPGSGCDNGVFASGAHLSGSGFAGVCGDSLVLTTTGLEPNNTGLYLQGNNAVGGGDGIHFGDGLRCAGGQLVRLQVRFCDTAGVSSTTLSIAEKGGVQPGDTKRYQIWYRTQSNPACGFGVNEFNLSNGYEITWLP